MKETTVRLFSLFIAVMALGSALSAFGQEKAPPVERGLSVQTGPIVQGAGPESLPVAGPSFAFVNSEFSFDKLVKGAPYSAEAVTEITQTLSDGNRIVNTTTAAVYRDSEGRTRREQTLKAIGPFAAAGEPLKMISINDPASGVAYVLDPLNRVAMKNHAFRIEAPPGGGTPGPVVAVGQVQNFTFSRTPNGEMQIMTGGGEMKTRSESDRPAARTESLGTQPVEGVEAVGTRTTITIPAGQIGNERPIEIVDERWYSTELQTTVMSRHADPRSGEIVYRLTNINRAEPDHSLFEVPANYTIKAGPESPPQFRLQRPTSPEQ